MAQTGTGKSGAMWHRTGTKTGVGGFTWRLSGIETVNQGINRALLKLTATSMGGLVAAANYVLNDADVGTPPLVPEDTGTLRNSRFVEPQTEMKSKITFVMLGYRTNYAAAVHEMMQSPSGAPINWTRAGSGPKWLEASLKRNADKILNIVAIHTNV